MTPSSCLRCVTISSPTTARACATDRTSNHVRDQFSRLDTKRCFGLAMRSVLKSTARLPLNLTAMRNYPWIVGLKTRTNSTKWHAEGLLRSRSVSSIVHIYQSGHLESRYSLMSENKSKNTAPAKSCRMLSTFVLRVPSYWCSSVRVALQQSIKARRVRRSRCIIGISTAWNSSRNDVNSIRSARTQ